MVPTSTLAKLFSSKQLQRMLVRLVTEEVINRVKLHQLAEKSKLLS